MVTPLPTFYAGHRFRSRLEARWAVFFNHLGIDWQYEPQGFLVNGQPYLPDFWLPAAQLWVEVKGSDDAWEADAARCIAAAETLGSLLVLGPVPDPDASLPVHILWLPHDSVAACQHWNTAASFGADLARLKENSPCYAGGLGPTTNPHVPGGRAVGPVRDAYIAARSARFEHGETPR